MLIAFPRPAHFIHLRPSISCRERLRPHIVNSTIFLSLPCFSLPPPLSSHTFSPPLPSVFFPPMAVDGKGRTHYHQLSLLRKRRTAAAAAAAAATKTSSPPSSYGNNYVGLMVRCHPILCVLVISLIFFMRVEYTLRMVPPSSPPVDLGFAATRWLNSFLASRPALNAFLAALNTVFVGMQTAYIFWAFLVEGRSRPGVAALFMFTCRGILGCSTQLPLPQDFLGSRADFPVGNVSFFLFFSGHVAAAVIASLDMRRMRRKELARMFDVLNALQVLRLLGTRGHYTIDLAAGVGAGLLFDCLAGKYGESKGLTA